MDRRGFVGAATAAIAGIGASGVVRANDFIFPRKSEDKPLLEGLTDEDMAALVGQFPQGEGRVQLTWGKVGTGYAPCGIEIREILTSASRTISLWTIEGTIIHLFQKMPIFEMNFDGYRSQTGWDYREYESLDVKSLNFIRLRMVDSRSEYRRKETASGVGWFGF